MRATNEEHRTILGDIKCSSWPDLSKEDVDDESPKNKDKVIWVMLAYLHTLSVDPTWNTTI
jgi:hypothetical protein